VVPSHRRLVEGFYRRMDVLPEAKGIRAMHAADLERLRCSQRYLCEWMGARSFIPPKRGIRGCASGIWLQNWRAGTRCVVALHEGRARRVCPDAGARQEILRFARKARRLDAQPGGQSPRHRRAASVTKTGMAAVLFKGGFEKSSSAPPHACAAPGHFSISPILFHPHCDG